MKALTCKLAAIGAGGCGLWVSYEYVSIGDSWMPNYRTLGALENGEGKYLKDIYRFFVNVDGSEDWMLWSFKHRFFGDRNGGMKVGDRFDGVTGMEAFRRACKEGYEKKGEDLSAADKVDLWRYCSPAGGKPRTVEEAQHRLERSYWREDGGPVTPWGKNKRAEVISSYDEGSGGFWEMKERMVREERVANGKDDGKKTVFDRFREGGEGSTLRDVCRRAYALDSEDSGGNGKVTATDLVKYCGINQLSTS